MKCDCKIVLFVGMIIIHTFLSTDVQGKSPVVRVMKFTPKGGMSQEEADVFRSYFVAECLFQKLFQSASRDMVELEGLRDLEQYITGDSSWNTTRADYVLTGEMSMSSIKTCKITITLQNIDNAIGNVLLSSKNYYWRHNDDSLMNNYAIDLVRQFYYRMYPERMDINVDSTLIAISTIESRSLDSNLIHTMNLKNVAILTQVNKCKFREAGDVSRVQEIVNEQVRERFGERLPYDVLARIMKATQAGKVLTTRIENNGEKGFYVASRLIDVKTGTIVRQSYYDLNAKPSGNSVSVLLRKSTFEAVGMQGSGLSISATPEVFLPFFLGEGKSNTRKQNYYLSLGDARQFDQFGKTQPEMAGAISIRWLYRWPYELTSGITMYSSRRIKQKVVLTKSFDDPYALSATDTLSRMVGTTDRYFTDYSRHRALLGSIGVSKIIDDINGPSFNVDAEIIGGKFYYDLLQADSGVTNSMIVSNGTFLGKEIYFTNEVSKINLHSWVVGGGMRLQTRLRTDRISFSLGIGSRLLYIPKLRGEKRGTSVTVDKSYMQGVVKDTIPVREDDVAWVRGNYLCNGDIFTIKRAGIKETNSCGETILGKSAARYLLLPSLSVNIVVPF
jgi:hypothetical protein